MAWPILAASAGWDDDVQTGRETAAGPTAGLDAGPAAALAGPAANSRAGIVKMAAVSALLGLTCILLGPPPSGCRQAADHIVLASRQAVQYPALDTPAAAAIEAS
jgi:hypothetical protein